MCVLVCVCMYASVCMYVIPVDVTSYLLGCFCRLLPWSSPICLVPCSSGLFAFHPSSILDVAGGHIILWIPVSWSQFHIHGRNGPCHITVTVNLPWGHSPFPLAFFWGKAGTILQTHLLPVTRLCPLEMSMAWAQRMEPSLSTSS